MKNKKIKIPRLIMIIIGLMAISFIIIFLLKMNGSSSINNINSYDNTVDLKQDDETEILISNENSYLIDNDRDYDWYYDQYECGDDRYGACVPTTISMVLRWRSEEYTLSLEEFLNKYHPGDNSNMSYLEMETIFENEEVDFIESKNYEIDDIVSYLKEDSIAVILLDMTKIDNQDYSESKIGKYYSTDYVAYHSIIIKGYTLIDDIEYFQVYDPIGGSYVSNDGSKKGINQMYNALQIYNAIKNGYRKIWIING